MNSSAKLSSVPPVSSVMDNLISPNILSFSFTPKEPHSTQKLSGIFGRTHNIVCTNLIIVSISERSNVWRNVTVIADTAANWLLLIMVTATIASVVYVHAWSWTSSSRILICHCRRRIRSCWTRPLHFTLVIIDRVVFTYAFFFFFFFWIIRIILSSFA